MRRGRAVASWAVLVVTIAGAEAADKPPKHMSAVLQSPRSDDAHCAFTPEIWHHWCTGATPGLEDLCRQFEGGNRPEKLALMLNVRASEKGLLPSGLGELRFRSGSWSAFTLAQWLEAESETSKLPVDLEALAAAANRNFGDGCSASLGALARDEVLPLCYEPDQRIRGPAGAACSVLSSECGIGFFDSDGGCCDIETRPFGIPCGDGGTCNGGGVCLPPSEMEASFETALFGEIRGTEHWVDVVGGGQAGVWFFDGGVRVSVDGRPVVDLKTAGGLDLSDVLAGVCHHEPGRRLARTLGLGQERCFVTRQ